VQGGFFQVFATEGERNRTKEGDRDYMNSHRICLSEELRQKGKTIYEKGKMKGKVKLIGEMFFRNGERTENNRNEDQVGKKKLSNKRRCGKKDYASNLCNMASGRVIAESSLQLNKSWASQA